MPLIHVRQTPGQTTEQKQELVRELTDAYIRVAGAPSEYVWITIQETSRDDWAIGGETLTARAAKP
jgi:4-oxalocrotonate tautomerase